MKKVILYILIALGLNANAVVPMPSYDVGAANYFYRARIFNPVERQAADKFFKTVRVNTTIWASLQGGAVYLVSPTSYGASFYNALSSSYTITSGVDPSYSTNGWSFNGSTQWLNSNFNANSLTTNTGYVMVYNRTNAAAAAAYIYGAANSTTEQWQFAPRFTADLVRMASYSSATALTAANANNSGRFIFNMRSSSDREVRRNEVSVGTSAVAIGGTKPNLVCSIGGRNNAGTTDSFYSCEIATLIQGLVGLSNANCDVLTTAVQTYNNTVIVGGR